MTRFTWLDEEELSEGERKDYLSLLSEIMDFSNYLEENPRYNNKFAACLGYWKDELAAKIMTFFIGLKSKTYTYLVEGGKQSTKCKGVRAAAKKTIPFEKFAACLEEVQKVDVKQVNIRAKNHQIMTLAIKKTAFSSFDDKRWLYNCGRHSSPYGSVLITADGECPLCNEEK